ncbi:hypothetical protein GQ53DRAFT_828325 [Thozetella sp. PMI_491]|nr:hypothetical protein GQ53DRAFT_828325 [Thozetella sp. PMI_491]
MLFIFLNFATGALAILAHPGRRALQASISAQAQSTTADPCLATIMPFVETLPTPPAELLSFMDANPQSDLCSYSVPDSMTVQISSYEIALSQWESSHSKQLASILSTCTGYDVLTAPDVSCSTAEYASSSGYADSSGYSGNSTTSCATSGFSTATAAFQTSTPKHNATRGHSAANAESPASRDVVRLVGVVAAAFLCGVVAL